MCAVKVDQSPSAVSDETSDDGAAQDDEENNDNLSRLDGDVRRVETDWRH